MGDLAAGMHARIGTSGDGEGWGLLQPKRAPQGCFEPLLDSLQAGLGRPAVERRAIVTEIDPEPEQGEPGRI